MQEYLKGFVHDIRTSLGVISGALDNKDAPDADYIAMARRQTQKALDLVRQLEYNMSQAKEKILSAMVNVATINQLVAEFTELYPKVKIRLDCKKDMMISTDIGIIRRVIDNCITNAFNAGKAPWVLLNVECDDDVLLIHIKDGGIGMCKRQIERLGLGFSTTGGGDGTRILIDLLIKAGGTARWESIQDVGTCVTLTFKAV